MDDEAIEYAARVLDDIGKAMEKIGMVLYRYDVGKTYGIPTGVITFPDERSESWAISCNVLMTHMEEAPIGFVQLFARLMDPLPEKRYTLEMFIEGCSKKFLLGSVGIFEDYLTMRYVLVLEQPRAINTDNFGTVLAVFVKQAEAVNRAAAGLCNGSLTMEQALDFNTLELGGRYVCSE